MPPPGVLRDRGVSQRLRHETQQHLGFSYLRRRRAKTYSSLVMQPWKAGEISGGLMTR